MVFPLDQDTNEDVILQLYCLLQPHYTVTRDDQFDGVPMTAEIHISFDMLKMGVSSGHVQRPRGIRNPHH